MMKKKEEEDVEVWPGLEFANNIVIIILFSEHSIVILMLLLPRSQWLPHQVKCKIEATEVKLILGRFFLLLRPAFGHGRLGHT